MRKDCPVCQSTLSKLFLVAQYHGHDYHLCSKQCRHNFQRRPHLYIGYADGTKSVKQQGLSYIKQRQIDLSQPLTAEVEQRMVACLMAMKGIRAFELQPQTLCVEYDLLEVSEEQIEYQLQKLDVAVSNSLLSKVKRAFIHFSEQNELDNAAAHLPCCNKPPVLSSTARRD